MPGIKATITNREKAAIFALVAGIFPDWKTAYIAAEQRAENEVNPNGLGVSVSRWKNCDKVQTYIDYCRRVLADREADARKRGREEERRGTAEEEGGKGNERTKSEESARVDYYDPANQRRQINRIIAQSNDDPKTQLDAIKAIQQTQRDDRQAAKEGRSVRVYLPLSCDICPLWQKAKAKRDKKG